MLFLVTTAAATVPPTSTSRVEFSEAGSTVSVTVIPTKTDEDLVLQVDLVCLGAHRAVTLAIESDIRATTSAELAVTPTCDDLTYFRVDARVLTASGDLLERARSTPFIQVEDDEGVVVTRAEDLPVLRPDLAADLTDDLFGGVARLEVTEGEPLEGLPVVEAQPHGSEAEVLP